MSHNSNVLSEYLNSELEKKLKCDSMECNSEFLPSEHQIQERIVSTSFQKGVNYIYLFPVLALFKNALRFLSCESKLQSDLGLVWSKLHRKPCTERGEKKDNLYNSKVPSGQDM